jgi:hypothetical protein
VNGQQDAGYRFADLHAQTLDIFGQARQCILHAVLRQVQCDVDVSADLERDCSREVTIPGRLAAHVEHVLDTVDLLFERRGDRAGHGVRRRPRIGCRDLHCRRDDFRVSGDREDREGAEAKGRHEDAEHGREARSIDKEMCEAHGEWLLVKALRSRVADCAVLWRDF